MLTSCTTSSFLANPSHLQTLFDSAMPFRRLLVLMTGGASMYQNWSVTSQYTLPTEAAHPNLLAVANRNEAQSAVLLVIYFSYALLACRSSLELITFDSG
jgi:hypothetical protein